MNSEIDLPISHSKLDHDQLITCFNFPKSFTTILAGSSRDRFYFYIGFFIKAWAYLLYLTSMSNSVKYSPTTITLWSYSDDFSVDKKSEFAGCAVESSDDESSSDDMSDDQYPYEPGGVVGHCGQMNGWFVML